MKRILVLLISATLCMSVSTEAKQGNKKKGNSNKAKTTKVKVSSIVKRIEEANDGTLSTGQTGVKPAAPDSQFQQWKNPFKIKVDPKLLNHGKKKRGKNNKRKRR